MENTKKAFGYYLRIITAVLTVIGLIAYFINSNTAYFQNIEINSVIVISTIVAIILCGLVIFVDKIKLSKIIEDFIPVIVGVLLVYSTVLLVSSRVNSIASIITFNNNAQNMSDMSSAIVAIAFLLFAVIINIVSSFFEVAKSK